MTQRNLRAVEPGDAPARAKTVTQAATSGTEREMLIALRARIARSIDDSGTPPRDLAALSRRLTDIAREIKSLDSDEGQDDISEATRLDDEAFDAATL